MAKKRIKKRLNKANRRSLSKGRYWLALGTLAACATGGGPKIALAQQPSTGSNGNRAPESVAALPARRYKILPGTLGAALDSFKQTSGLTVSASENRLLDVHTDGLDGSYTVEEAIRALLNGSGVDYRFDSDKQIVLSLRHAEATVNVNDTVNAITTSVPKIQGQLTDVPLTVDVVSQRTMQEQGVTTLRDALRNVAGISLAAGEGGSQGDNLTIRGFTARNDLYIDGMRDFGSYYRDPFNTQEVEVLQGPESVTFGRGSTGGVVNQQSKEPGLDRFLAADLQFGTDTTRRGVLDINLPVPSLGKGASFRLTAMGDIDNVAGRDVATNRRGGIAPSLAFGLGTDTRVTLSYFHQNADDTPDYGLPWLFNGPAPVNRNLYYGLEDGNFLRTADDIGTARIEHDINPHVTIRDQFRYANYGRDAIITEPQLTGVTFGESLAAMQVNRNEISVASTESYLDDQLDAIGKFTTFGLRHSVVSGFEASRETSDPTRYKNTAPKTSLLDPDGSDLLLLPPTTTSVVTDSAISLAGYLVDTVDVGRKVSLTGGVRYDNFDNTYAQTVAPASNLERVDHKTTWRAAAVYHPIPIGSIYFDAGTSFNPSAESLSLSASTVNVAPETNRTYEFGTKWAFNKARLTANASVFRTTKDNAREASPTNSLLTVLAGTQKVSGTEADLRGRVTSRWDMVASYAYLDSRVVGSMFYPLSIGYPLGNVPRHTFAYWNNYRYRRWDLGLGSNYESSRTASSTAPLDPTTGFIKQVPGYWVFNAMVGHPINEHIDIQVNAYNLANRYYYDQLHPGHIVLGPGRSALVDLRFKF